MPDPAKPWPHAPNHRLADTGTFMITAGTYGKAHHFSGATRLRVLERGLLKLTAEHGWRMEAWSVFSNHYHFVAHAPGDGAASFSTIAKELHAKSALWVNRVDGTPGRKVWHNFWDTRLTHESSYFARLHYVHANAVRHGLVPVASHYPWCSAAWFEQCATRAQVRTVYGMKN